ncbi:hypothetical protein K438DRAFT_719298 [Mycena galopus ATCC 62051]|nr:hypothetical protein K438DRAFT_719298 [Mycena galopus ATCC 62051]
MQRSQIASPESFVLVLWSLGFMNRSTIAIGFKMSCSQTELRQSAATPYKSLSFFIRAAAAVRTLSETGGPFVSGRSPNKSAWIHQSFGCSNAGGGSSGAGSGSADTRSPILRLLCRPAFFFPAFEFFLAAAARSYRT